MTQIPLDRAGRADDPARDAQHDDGTHDLTADLSYKRLAIVNIAFFGAPNAPDRGWILIDAGVPGTAGSITSAAKQRFGDARPAAIIMTHGHFDHVGALKTLSEQWDAPIYAHELELPYLDGRASYPPADPSVGGGLMAFMSPLYPAGPFDAGPRLNVLPADGSVPFMTGWKWLPTPGHSPGHISLWRESDRTLIVGDAFITTKQESAFAVALQKPEMHGPPMYYTPDWVNAKASVERLAALDPELVVTGHGPAMQGAQMRDALHLLARDFDRVAVPDHGRYVGHPAQANESGPTFIPPASSS